MTPAERRIKVYKVSSSPVRFVSFLTRFTIAFTSVSYYIPAPNLSIMSSFAESSRDVRIENRGPETWLVCEAQAEDGSWQPAEINLDDVIGNDDGQCPTFISDGKKDD
ncbi:unnamed protein product [Aspergillus oryzae]|nr:unnamed protein product [Aspergillus oryzae]